MGGGEFGVRGRSTSPLSRDLESQHVIDSANLTRLAARDWSLGSDSVTGLAASACDWSFGSASVTRLAVSARDWSLGTASVT